ncbi:uncharacterized protein LOC143038274 [Oratosquilla oratoria]|uniref:uncharacterized protein LOC143038274 n=1 Tax=Oratosquilla oratoria TaxID=337810 RepID=UPI003F762B83
MNEHKRSIKYGQESSAVFQHMNEFNHRMDWDKSNLIYKSGFDVPSRTCILFLRVFLYSVMVCFCIFDHDGMCLLLFISVAYLYSVFNNVLVFCNGTQAIKITNFVVPETLEGGKESKLLCEWQTEGDQLYSLKWYVGLHEFYRYTPAGVSPKQVFASDAFTVDLTRSGKGHVTIQNVTVMAAGVYRCEISAEAPSFQTDSKVMRVDILVIPHGKPHIAGVRDLYHTGEIARLTCHSPKARPKPNLVFYVNNQKANTSQVQPLETLTDEDGLHQSSLILHLPIRPSILQNTGVIRVRCECSIPRRYNEIVDEILRVSVPLHASVRGGRTSRGFRIIDRKPNAVMAKLLLIALVPLFVVT